MTPALVIAAQPKGEAWHSQSAEDVLAKHGYAATGLSAQEASQRLAANGPNELMEGKRIRPFQIFLGQFKSPIIWILIVAAFRYPGGGSDEPMPSREEFDEALQHAQTIYDFVVNLLPADARP